ncbi:MAG: hypothetical protein JWO79_2930 [Actinomycetia bacterium]|jgi:hypothetical protein|nr:hypothetical protein [Actinomycetes bacterium]
MHPTPRSRIRLLALTASAAALLGTYLTVTTSSASAADALISQGQSTTASSLQTPAYPASSATDGDATTRWSSAAGDPQWIQVDLGAPATVSSVALNWEAAYATAFTIQVSPDAAAWTTVSTVTNGTGGRQTLAVSGTGRYVRLNATARASAAWGISLFEFQVFGSGGAPPGTGPGWISVDPAQQAAAVAAFYARTPRTPPANAVRVPEFHASCFVSHHANDDPIVFPNLPGASHNHTFLGNTTTNAASTFDSLKAGATNCTPTGDHASYWIPTLYHHGVAVDPQNDTTIYYGSRLVDTSKVIPFPPGLRMIVGDAKLQTSPDDSHFYCAGPIGEIGRSADGKFPKCAAGDVLMRQLMFPDCWDGKHLDSPNHKDHMAWMDGTGKCPASHPWGTPSISMMLVYPLNTDTDGITLASGTYASMHGDFFNAWDENELARRVRDCIDQSVKCNANGDF